MSVPVIMPRQGQSVESCIISNWFFQKGDRVKKGDILFSYETDKAAFEVEAEADGLLLERYYNEGDEVPVLSTVAMIGEEGDEVEEAGAKRRSRYSGIEKVEMLKSGNVEKWRSDGVTGETIFVSPRARKAAERLGITLEGITGTGPGGRIIEKDVQEAAGKQSLPTPLAREIALEENRKMPAAGSGAGGRVTSFDVLAPAGGPAEEAEIRKVSNIRRIIAQKMHESLMNSAQLTHHTSADARRLLELRKKAKALYEKSGIVDITINDLVCYAVIRAVKKHPMANSHFLGDTVRLFRKVHLGLAVDTERGLMVPVVKNADDLSIKELAMQIKEVAASCKKGNISPELLSSEAASFSVSNLGAYGVEMFTPVINLPQVAILGVDAIINRPADLGNGVLGFCPHIGLSLTYDHRALDGAPASALLRDIRLEIERLEVNI